MQGEASELSHILINGRRRTPVRQQQHRLLGNFTDKSRRDWRRGSIFIFVNKKGKVALRLYCTWQCQK